MARYSGFRLVKKVLIYVIIIILSFGLGSLITYLILNKSINYEGIYDSVVYIESIDEDTIKSGSGFVYKIYGDKTYIITSYHVIEGYTDINVYNNKKKSQRADIIDYDENSDIAILSIDNDLGLKEIDISNSDKVDIGDEIYVVGTPLNIDYINTISKGIITFVNREITIDTNDGYRNFKTIQVDAKVDNGNSGGPLLNNKGEVIGMMSMKEYNLDGISFAIPINIVIDVVKKLESSKLDRPNLGAVICNTTNKELLIEYQLEIIDITGVVVLDIKESYPLQKSGLKKGDIITKFNNEEITNINELKNKLYKTKKGYTVIIEYYRQGENYKVNIK